MVFKNIERLKRLFLKKNGEKSFLFIKKITGFPPINTQLYKLALIHKSSSTTDTKGHLINNERLEFLGDAVLNAVISDILYTHFPKVNEGFLTNARSKLVSRSILNQIASDIGLEPHIHTTNNNSNTNIPGNTLEALIGAVYLDLGYDNCRTFIEKKLYPRFRNLKSVVNTETNFKSVLMEWCQKNRHEIQFKLVEEHINHKNVPTFVSHVYIDGEFYAEGKGHSKKESHQAASQKALSIIKTTEK